MVKVLLSAVLFSLSLPSLLMARDFGLSPSQKHFTSIVRELPGVGFAEWRSPVSLYVKATSRALGSPPKPELAQRLADMLAERGRTAMRQPFCVHIIHGSSDARIARSCAFL